jgi:hypothetical protein
MRNILYALLVAAFLLAPALGQDALVAAPDSYKLDFENEYVKVVRVHYEPKSTIPAHDHTLTGSAYVYLNDCGPVVFKHIKAAYGAVKRPAVKAGSFRLYRAVSENHEVENPNDTPSDFLRVEFKTEPVNEKSLMGKFYREDPPTTENYSKTQFENEQIRATRLVIAPGKKLQVSARESEPALFVALTPTTLTVQKKRQPLTLEMGKTYWVAAKDAETFENRAAEPVEFLRFDFKTKPVAVDQKKTPHPH